MVRPRSAGLRLGVELAIGGRGARELHLGAVRPGPLHLHRRRRRRHHDHGRRPEQLRRHRHRLAVIAGRVGDDASLQLLGRELRNHVERATNLERAHRLKGLGLQIESGAGNREPGTGPPARRGGVSRGGGPVHFKQRRHARSGLDPLARGADVLQCHQSRRCLHPHFPFVPSFVSFVTSWFQSVTSARWRTGRRRCTSAAPAPPRCARRAAASTFRSSTAPLKSHDGSYSSLGW